MRKMPEMASRSSYSAMGNERFDYGPNYAYDKEWKFGAQHCHDFYELYIHLHGAKYYCIDGTVYSVEPYQLLLVPPFKLHGHVGTYIPVDYERAFLYITPALLRKAGANMIDLEALLGDRVARGQYHYLMSREEAYTCANLLRNMQIDMEDDSPLGQFRNYSRMLDFLCIVCKTVQSSAQEAKPVVVNEVMQEVLSYVNDHFSQPLRLTELAKRFGVSVSYLSHEFGKYTGRSVYDYILARRVLQSKEMMNSGMALSEAAYQCGFSDYSSFLRAFKKETGMSPNAYRQKAKIRQGN